MERRLVRNLVGEDRQTEGLRYLFLFASSDEKSGDEKDHLTGLLGRMD